MIRHFYIDNFKSLVDFSLPPKPERLGKFTCLIGMNGAGKSTVLQAFDFVKQLVHGRIDDWLKVREWKIMGLTSRFTRKRLITFRLTLEFPEHGMAIWEGQFNPILLRCTSESIYLNAQEILRFNSGVAKFTAATGFRSLSAQNFNFQGSVLSALKLERAHPAICDLRDFICDLKSLDMLAPNLMRKHSREAQDIGYGGERLSAFLHGFSSTAYDSLLDEAITENRLSNILRRFYPQILDIETSSIHAGWKDISVVEKYKGSTVSTSSCQLNDGMLRILAILSQVEAINDFKHIKDDNGQRIDSNLLAKEAGLIVHHEYRALLFDEIENGIHPELIEKLVAYLLKAQQQILVTTHSPMILNYLPDDVAKEAVILLYRTEKGITRSIRYFDLSSTQKKLKLLGPGEVFVDTDFSALIEEAEALRGAA